MFKKINRKNKKGFTLAELLIVVAIIGVLVAISIPIFTTQLEKSREAVDASNIRSAYAEAMTDYLANGAKAAASKTTTAAKSSGAWESSPDWNAELVGKVPTSVTQGTTFTVTVAADGTVSVAQP